MELAGELMGSGSEGKGGPSGPGESGLGLSDLEIPSACLGEEVGQECAEALGISPEDLEALKNMSDPCAEASNED